MFPAAATADHSKAVMIDPIEISIGRNSPVRQIPSVAKSDSTEKIQHTINAATSAQSLLITSSAIRHVRRLSCFPSQPALIE